MFWEFREKYGVFERIYVNEDEGNTYFIPQEATPTRGENLSRIIKGLIPVYVDPRTQQKTELAFHHLTQENTKSYIVALPKNIHQAYSGILHPYNKYKSKIERSTFKYQSAQVVKALFLPSYEEKPDILKRKPSLPTLKGQKPVKRTKVTPRAEK